MWDWLGATSVQNAIAFFGLIALIVYVVLTYGIMNATRKQLAVLGRPQVWIDPVMTITVDRPLTDYAKPGADQSVTNIRVEYHVKNTGQALGRFRVDATFGNGHVTGGSNTVVAANSDSAQWIQIPIASTTLSALRGDLTIRLDYSAYDRGPEYFFTRTVGITGYDPLTNKFNGSQTDIGN
jgi:hypothetical protein